LRKSGFAKNTIFAVNFAQTFLLCPSLHTHEVLGSNPAFERNRNFAEFFAVYRENCVFRPHRSFPENICRTCANILVQDLHKISMLKKIYRHFCWVLHNHRVHSLNPPPSPKSGNCL
jgi:hypothetical protein